MKNTITQDFVNSIDSDLSYDSILAPSTFRVYKVKSKSEGTPFILKIQQEGSHFFNWVAGEARILELAKNISGVTHLVKNYGHTPYGYAILKEYFEGDAMCYVDNVEIGSGVKGDIAFAIDELASLGIGDLDMIDSNIVVSPDRKKAKLVDIGSSNSYPSIFKYLPFSKLRKENKSDHRLLEDMFGF